MLRARDSAFIVDHRRQLSVPAPAVAGAKKDELSKKKKAGQHLQRAQQKAQQDAPAKAPGGKKAKAAPAIGTTGDAPAPKKSAKQKASKKEKAAKAAAAATAAAAGAAAKDAKVATAGGKKAAVAKAAVTTIAAATSAQTKVRMVGEMEQDGLKSRNLKMFLAPSRSANASHLPSWGTRHTSAFSSSSVADRLHDEILEYTNYTRATVEQMRVHIEEMIANVRECVHSLWPQSKVETFGSYSTGIWLPSSDVDLVVLDVLEVIDSKKTVKHLRELAKVLGSQSWVESIVVLETAKIPVLKLVSAESSVPIDITFESAATHSGLLARDLIKRYAEEIPELYPLAIVFKQLLRERGLNDAYTGGLSSYSVVLMLIHFSQLRRNGQQCFEAAAVYASGSIPPLPSTLTPLDKLAKNLGDSAHSSTTTKIETQYSKSEVELAKESELVKKTSPAESPSVSYAAALGRSSSSKDQVASENENQIATSSKACAPATTPRFSYAAVAAGAVRVTPPAPPPSYAAALTAKPGTYDTSVSLSHKKAGAPFTSSARPLIAASESGAKSLKRDTATSDTISISSSYADTEESTSSVASNASSTADSDDEISKGLEQIPECSDVNEATDVSLGAHTLMILEFFGILFDYRKNGLSIRDGGYIYRLAENRRTEIGKPSLVIEDPIHPDRNVSASSFAFSKVVAVFEDSFYALKYYRPSKFAPTALSCLLSCSGHTVSVATKKTV